jgi:hypothetical protein
MDNFNIKNEIINYIENIFESLDSKRQLLLDTINDTSFNILSKEKLIVFLNDIYSINVNINDTIESIFFLVKNKDQSNTDNVVINNKVKMAIVLASLL